MVLNYFNACCVHYFKMKEKKIRPQENRHMKWRFTWTKPPYEMAVYLNQTATSCGVFVVKANRHLMWRFCLKKLKKKTLFHVDGIVGNSFPNNVKWELFFFRLYSGNSLLFHSPINLNSFRYPLLSFPF